MKRINARRNRSARIYEWLLVASLIGVILVFAVGYYGRMVGDVQRLSFELAAQNFKAAVSGVRVQWYVQRAQGESGQGQVVYGELPGHPLGREAPVSTTIYLNAQGWPVNTRSAREAKDRRLTLEECQELWQALLHGAPVLSSGPSSQARAGYGVEQVGRGSDSACRYRHLIGGEGGQYFDYFPSDGRFVINLSSE